jgi:hypothetical protein
MEELDPESDFILTVPIGMFLTNLPSKEILELGSQVVH